MRMEHKLPLLPYGDSDLQPYISQETVEFHYRKHEQTYINNLNKLIAGTIYENTPLEDIIRHANGGIFNNASQAWNHIFYFFAFKKPAENNKPAGKLLKAIEDHFGSFEDFKKKFVDAGAGLFGSGWVWLCKDAENKLSIVQTSNAGSPLTENLVPLLCFDVWEHAYYIDYRNRRPEYLDKLWNIVDWDVVSSRFE